MSVVHQNMLSSAEFAMTNLFSSFLRLAAATCACWNSFSTSTHITCNVVSGRKLSLRHSVEHYEAILLNSCFISRAKIDIFLVLWQLLWRNLYFLKENLEKLRLIEIKAVYLQKNGEVRLRLGNERARCTRLALTLANRIK